jgi:hypothetical protein
VAAPYTLTVTNCERGFRGKENTSGAQTLSAETSSCTSVRATARSEFNDAVARKFVNPPSRGTGKSRAPHTWKYANEELSILFTYAPPGGGGGGFGTFGQKANAALRGRGVPVDGRRGSAAAGVTAAGGAAGAV